MPTLDRKKLIKLVEKKDFKKIYESDRDSWWIHSLPSHLQNVAREGLHEYENKIEKEKSDQAEKFAFNQIKQYKRPGGILENRKSKNVLKFKKRIEKQNLIAKENNKWTWPYILWENPNLTGKLVKMLPLRRNEYYGLELYVVEYVPNGQPKSCQRYFELPNDRDSYAFLTGRYMAEIDENSLMPKHWPEDTDVWYELFIEKENVLVQRKFFTSI